MAYIKLYEEFGVDDFSDKDFNEVTRDELIQWWKSANQNKTISEKETLFKFISKVSDICKEIGGEGDFHYDFYQPESFYTETFHVGASIYVPDSNKSKRIYIKANLYKTDEDFDFGLIATSDESKMGVVDGISMRLPLTGLFFICVTFDGLRDALTKLKEDGFFTKPPKEPKPYKQEQVLTDEDFQSRNIDNQMRAQFYREYSRILKDIPFDLPFEERRTKSLELLDNWFENLQ